MTAFFRPSRAVGTMATPPSKSAAHRLLLCAGLAEGESALTGVAPSQDMLATMDCLRALGCEIAYDGAAALVRGAERSAVCDGAVLPCRECGSTLRFFVPIALLTGRSVTLTGSRKLFSRPLSVYETLCRERGFDYALTEDSLRVRGTLRAGRYTVPGDISSQFISGLLFALPLCAGDSEIALLPPVESRPYIDMTLRALREFGVAAEFTDPLHLRVPGAQRYRAHAAAVEGDWSNAAFFDALTCLGGDVTLTGLDPESPQGDRVYPALFGAICAGADAPIDLSDCPDLGPVCMALAAAKGGARFTGTRRLRIKESDRCAAMAEELKKMGVDSAVGEDDMTVFPGVLRAPAEPLSGHNDHRIVMAMSLLLTLTGGGIGGAQAVSKSLPDFFDRLKTLGIEVETDGMDH